jgi:hypothetical protein
MRNTIALTLLCMSLLVMTACKDATIEVPRLNGLAITDNPLDGAVFWGIDDPFVSAGFWQYADTLNIRLQSRSIPLARSIRNGDMTFWLDLPQKGQQPVGLQFRGPMLIRAQGRKDNGNPDLQQRKRPNIERVSSIEQLYLLLEEEEIPAAATAKLAHCYSFIWEDDVWILDLSLPMQTDLLDGQGFVIHPGAVLNVKLKEERPDMEYSQREAGGGRMKGMGGRGGIGGGRSGMGGGRGGKGGGRAGSIGNKSPGDRTRPQLAAELDVSLQLRLVDSDNKTD